MRVKEDSDQKGESSELAVNAVLEQLKHEGKIKNVVKTKKYQGFDLGGIDFLVSVEIKKKTKCIPLGVNSSLTGALMDKHLKDNPRIEPVVVTYTDRYVHRYSLREKILKVIKKYI